MSYGAKPDVQSLAGEVGEDIFAAEIETTNDFKQVERIITWVMYHIKFI